MQEAPSAKTDPGTAPWINRDMYPWTAKAFTVPAGTMRYLDEGAGKPIVMVHGNPSWSFGYARLVMRLSDRYRCIAPDHIGFGQSDKPYDWSYLPKDHAANLEALLESLDLHDITLVINDWGGPTGLSYAAAHPERVKRLVIFNTWAWSVKDDRYYRRFSGFMGGPIGRFLIRYFNFFARSVVLMAYGDRKKLTREVHRHYLDALPTPQSRKGSWVFPREIIGSSDWLASLWEKRELFTAKPTLLLWGMKDIAFREDILHKWQEAIPHAEVTRFETAGHFVGSEQAEPIAQMMADFIERT
jgi:haloalkane dehalogenase